MTKLSATQIGTLVRQAGWPDADVKTAIAVALAESGGRTDAVGDLNRVTPEWGPSIGLFQIRSLNAEKGKGTTRDEDSNRDGLNNAKHALAIKQSSGWSAWSAYTNQSFRLFMPDATLGAAGSAGAAAVEGSAVGKAATTVANSTEAIVQIAKEPARVLQWLTSQETQIRIGKVIVGGGLILAGLILFARPLVDKVPGAGKAVKLIGG